MKTKDEMAFEHIARLRAGMDQDLADIEKWWPESKRGSRANRAFRSLVERFTSAIETAEESLPK
jgi:hypothetical protein